MTTCSHCGAQYDVNDMSVQRARPIPGPHDCELAGRTPVYTLADRQMIARDAQRRADEAYRDYRWIAGGALVFVVGGLVVIAMVAW